MKFFEKYLEAIEKGPAAAGELVVDLDDATCKALYEELLKDDRTKDKLVRPLWFNYKTQSFRWEK